MTTSPSRWLMVVHALAIATGALGLLFILWPGPASSLFGIPADSDDAVPYVRALGIRDLALCFYLLAVARLSERATGAVLGVSVLIPAGDLLLVLSESGISALGPLALHAASGFCLAALALALKRQDRPRVMALARAGQRDLERGSLIGGAGQPARTS